MTELILSQPYYTSYHYLTAKNKQGETALNIAKTKQLEGIVNLIKTRLSIASADKNIVD